MASGLETRAYRFPWNRSEQIMSLDEMAIAYSQPQERQGIPNAQIKSKWKPRLQSYLKHPDRLKLSEFLKLMQIVCGEIVLRYTVVNRNEISIEIQ